MRLKAAFRTDTVPRVKDGEACSTRAGKERSGKGGEWMGNGEEP